MPHLTILGYKFGYLGWCTVDTTPSRSLQHFVFELGIPRRPPFWRPFAQLTLKKRIYVV